MGNAYRVGLKGGIQPSGNAVAADVLTGKTFMNANGAETGSMVNNGAVSETLDAGQSYTIPVGYHNGSGTVTAKPRIPFLVCANYGGHLYFISSDGNDVSGYGGYIKYDNNYAFSATLPLVGTLKYTNGTLRIIPTTNMVAKILSSTVSTTSEEVTAVTSTSLTANSDNDIAIANGEIMHIYFE